jgi:hypothetical protein
MPDAGYRQIFLHRRERPPATEHRHPASGMRYPASDILHPPIMEILALNLLFPAAPDCRRRPWREKSAQFSFASAPRVPNNKSTEHYEFGRNAETHRSHLD